MQQLHDFNTVCYEKVIQQVRNGHQVGCFTNFTENLLYIKIFDGSVAECILCFSLTELVDSECVY